MPSGRANWFCISKDKKDFTLDLNDSRIKKDRKAILVAKTWHKGRVLLGYAKVNEKLGYFVYKGKVLRKEDFQLLRKRKNLAWKLHKKGWKIPKNAFLAGVTRELEKLYIGRVIVKGVELAGQVCGSVCHVAKGDEVFEAQTFQILVIEEKENSHPAKCIK
ncbi:Hypothetical predicted protein [Cloeon dipterum]|uniref:Uncharacterized protein n=1 Tax=Cloeon dipterum TaxID=197152 RepID=A0A8S1D664_9INSE|nr:Hypothetical predicted protein [Cloeon dipterum]